MRASAVIFFAIVAVTSAAKIPTKRSTYSANLNHYVDSVITNLQTILTENKLDSISLLNHTESFSVKPILITYSGRLSLHDGILQDLNTVRRYGDIVLTYSDKVLTLSANVGLDIVNINYNYDAKLIGFLKANGRMVGNVKTIDTGAILSANLKTYTLNLDSFAINKIGRISAALRDNVLIDWFANAIISLTVAIVKNDVIGTFETKVTSAVQDLLEQVNAAIVPASFA